MAWINIRPENSGGGRQPKEPVAKLYSTGQFTLSRAAVAILGDPAKVRVQNAWRPSHHHKPSRAAKPGERKP